MKETFKDIKGYEGKYQVSNLGRVKSLIGLTDRIMKPSKKKAGYLEVQFGKGGKCFLVHRLVSKHFRINILDKPHVNHKDGNKANNNVSNLEWCTRSENQLHAYRTGLQKVSNHKRANGENCGQSKLSESEVLEIREKYNGSNGVILSKEYNVSQVSILNIKNRKTWKHL